jgi:hypothetical protein
VLLSTSSPWTISAVQQVGQRRYVMRLMVREVLDHAKGITREDAGVQHHGAEVRLQVLQREGETRYATSSVWAEALPERSIEAAGRGGAGGGGGVIRDDTRIVE